MRKSLSEVWTSINNMDKETRMKNKEEFERFCKEYDNAQTEVITSKSFDNAVKTVRLGSLVKHIVRLRNEILEMGKVKPASPEIRRLGKMYYESRKRLVHLLPMKGVAVEMNGKRYKIDWADCDMPLTIGKVEEV